jgi:hypothetical protein
MSMVLYRVYLAKVSLREISKPYYILISRTLKSGAYYLQANGSLDQYPVHCHMAEIDGCGGGGWTLVLKTDGFKVRNTFHDSFRLQLRGNSFPFVYLRQNA